jgi:hypothetical protein
MPPQTGRPAGEGEAERAVADVQPQVRQGVAPMIGALFGVAGRRPAQAEMRS